jgi:chromosome segregation ATPase
MYAEPNVDRDQAQATTDVIESCMKEIPERDPDTIQGRPNDNSAERNLARTRAMLEDASIKIDELHRMPGDARKETNSLKDKATGLDQTILKQRIEIARLKRLDDYVKAEKDKLGKKVDALEAHNRRLALDLSQHMDEEQEGKARGQLQDLQRQMQEDIHQWAD